MAEQKIKELHDLIKGLFPDAVSVSIFVSAKDIKVVPTFIANPSGYDTHTISGRLLERSDGE